MDDDAIFRDAFTHASVGMCLATLDEGRWSQVNPALCALLGYSADELRGIGFDEVTHVDDIDDNVEGARRLRAGEIAVYETEKRYLHADGHLIWVSLSMSLLRDAQNVPRCFIAQVVNVTDRKAADAALLTSQRQLADAQALGGVGSWEWDLEADRVICSDELCRIVGFVPVQNATAAANRVMTLVHEEDRERVAQTLERTRESGVSEIEYRLVRPDGDVRWVHSHRRTSCDADGRPVRMSGTLRDITGGRAAEHALREAEERFRRSFDEAPIGMALVSLQGRWMRVNDSLCELVGYTPAELMQLRFQDITHPDDLNADEEFVRQMIAGERGTYQMDKRYLHADGRIVWVQLNVSLARDGAGQPMYFIAQIQDVSDQRERQLELDRRRTALADAQAIAHIGSWSWDPTSDLAEWSAELYRVFGRDPADGPATAEDLFAYIQPDDRDRIAAGYAEAFGAGEEFELEYQIVAGGGELRSVHVLGRRDADGRYVGTLQDVTDRRRIESSLDEAEELLALAFEQSPLGMTLSTPDRRSLRVNQAFADMLGYSVADLINSQDSRHYTHPDDHAVDNDHVRALLDGEEQAGQWDKRYIHADGHSFWARISVSVLRASNGAPRHLISQIEDISERKQREAEERGLRDVAELVAASAEPVAIFGAISKQVRELSDANTTAVMRFDAGSNTGVVLGGWTPDGASLVGKTCDLDGATASAAVFRTGRPARVDALVLTAGDPMNLTLRRFGLTGSVAAPIHVAGKLWGAVGAAFDDQRIAVGAELRLERFAHLASLAIANLQTLETLEHRAATDPLTGIANHRTFHDRLRSEIERARRYDRDLSVVLLDLDHFKAVNDWHGHQVGDRILKEVAQRLTAEAREGELVARIGGEEFAWLIPESDQYSAYAAAERVRRAIESTPFADVGAITLSAGVCSREHDRDAQQLVNYADRALYWAKEHGRNVTCVYRDEAHAVDVVLRDD